ncbi:uncharacterized protein LOC143041687 [Oratosquilla oratoria]|uniref:uncharacterized protein LOC143041687 n=1 Tax=Oratosquilla oratoria TaxID=337810 RepID=UPI003F76DD21
MSTFHVISNLAREAQTALQTSGFDMRSFFKGFDFGTLGLLAAVAVLVVFAIDALAKLFPAYLSTTAAYGRSLLKSSAKAWPEIKQELTLEDLGPRGRSLEVLTPVMDALQTVVLKWGIEDEEAPEESQPRIPAVRGSRRNDRQMNF